MVCRQMQLVKFLLFVVAAAVEEQSIVPSIGRSSPAPPVRQSWCRGHHAAASGVFHSDPDQRIKPAPFLHIPRRFLASPCQHNGVGSSRQLNTHEFHYWKKTQKQNKTKQTVSIGSSLPVWCESKSKKEEREREVIGEMRRKNPEKLITLFDRVY